MGTVAVIGEESTVAGYALCGVLVLAAADPDAVHQAWRSLPTDVDVVILTRAAAAALDERDPGERDPGERDPGERDPVEVWPLVAVMPDG